jgi:hypothetical protein
MNMDRWDAYLFETHPEATLRAWARRLHLFRFCRAYGGQANDADSLQVVYSYQRFEELNGFLRHLGVKLVTFDEQTPRPDESFSYSGYWDVAGERALIWCEQESIRISVGEEYGVTELAVQAAEQIEKALIGVSLVRLDPPVDHKRCICPKYYPEYFG